MRTYSVAIPDVLLGVVVRPRRIGNRPEVFQTLLFFKDGIRILEGSQNGEPFKLGPELRCTDSETGEAFAWSPHRRVAPAYDPVTDSVYFFHKCGLMQLDANDNVSLFAGSVDDPDDTDGVGPAARFGWPACTAADGRGCLFVSEEYWNGFRKVYVADGAGAAAGSAPADRRPVGSVETVHEASHCKFVSLACPTAASGLLLAASRNALYRVPVTAPFAGAAIGGAAATGGAVPELLAGMEEPSRLLDGPCDAARFEAVSSILAAPDGGSAFLVDGNQLRRADLAAREVVTVTTLAADANDCLAQLVLLPRPDGCVAVCVQQLKTLLILQDPEFATAGGSSGGYAAAAAAFGGGGGSDPRSRSLAELLLQQHPPGGSSADGSAVAVGGSATVVIRVGGSSITAHRAVLAHRCEYFASLLEGGFREGGADEVELPDADAAAFGALLAYMYTGVLGELPEPSLRSAAELAERLLLSGASAQLQQRLLAASTPSTLLVDLVWAERHNLRELAERLKARMFNQRQQVRASSAPETVRQLALQYPDVLAELFLAALG